MLNNLATKEVKIKTTLRFASLLLEWWSSRTQTTTNIGEDIRENEPSYTAGGKEN
jgi:hypothetical protein